MGGAGDSLKSVFGKADPSATNSMLDGKVVATGTPGATEVSDTHQGLSSGNDLARSLFQSGAKGLSQMSQPPQRSGGGPQITQIQQPQLAASAFGQNPQPISQQGPTQAGMPALGQQANGIHPQNGIQRFNRQAFFGN